MQVVGNLVQKGSADAPFYIQLSEAGMFFINQTKLYK